MSVILNTEPWLRACAAGWPALDMADELEWVLAYLRGDAEEGDDD